jgi:hypothetical protein
MAADCSKVLGAVVRLLESVGQVTTVPVLIEETGMPGAEVRAALECLRSNGKLRRVRKGWGKNSRVVYLAS